MGDLGVAGEEAPVDVCSVSDVWVVIFCGCGLEDLLDEGLSLWLVWLFEKELDDGRQYLELCLQMVSP